MSEQRFVITDHLWQRTTAARQGYGSWRYRKGQPSVSRSCPLESGHQCAVAGSTRLLRELEQSAGPLPALGSQWCVAAVVRDPQWRS